MRWLCRAVATDLHVLVGVLPPDVGQAGGAVGELPPLDGRFGSEADVRRVHVARVAGAKQSAADVRGQGCMPCMLFRNRCRNPPPAPWPLLSRATGFPHCAPRTSSTNRCEHRGSPDEKGPAVRHGNDSQGSETDHFTFEQQRQRTDAQGNKLLRSPEFPFISLAVALTRTQQILEHGGEPHPPGGSLWGYSPGSSNAKRIAAALRTYGGHGSDLITMALTSSDQAERLQYLRMAAFTPWAAKRVYGRWPALASETDIRRYMISELNFRSRTVAAPLRILLENYSFAQLDSDWVQSAVARDKLERLGWP